MSGRLSTTAPKIRAAGWPGYYSLLIVANLGVWAWALYTFRDQPLLLGTALLAYSFGLRHAVDADHIAAIDNVTRKLMQEGKRPVSVGFWFSLGHSTVVVLVGAGDRGDDDRSSQSRFDALKDVGGIVGTLGLDAVPVRRSRR